MSDKFPVIYVHLTSKREFVRLADELGEAVCAFANESIIGDEPDLLGLVSKARALGHARSKLTPLDFDDACSKVEVSYEPAVGRCKTCSFYDIAKYAPGFKLVDSELVCRHRDGLKHIPQDGSGFCHLHSERKRGEDG